jgi:pyrroloquinoline quinone biosynthesis protein D
MSHEESFQRSDILELNPMFLFRWEEAQNAHVLLYPEGLVKLNTSAGEILAVVAETIAVGELLDRFTKTYNNEDIAEDVLAFLEASHERGWIRVKR